MGAMSAPAGDAGEWRPGRLSWSAAVVVLVVVVLGWWLVAQRTPAQEVTTEAIAPGQVVSRPVQEGEVIASFPEEFLFEPDADVTESYEILNTGSDAVFPTVTYSSSLSMEENIALFRGVLVAGSWEITQEAGPIGEIEGDTTFFYATRGSEEVNITFVATDAGITVKVAYFLKGEIVE